MLRCEFYGLRKQGEAVAVQSGWETSPHSCLRVARLCLVAYTDPRPQSGGMCNVQDYGEPVREPCEDQPCRFRQRFLLRRHHCRQAVRLVLLLNSRCREHCFVLLRHPGSGSEVQQEQLLLWLNGSTDSRSWRGFAPPGPGAFRRYRQGAALPPPKKRMGTLVRVPFKHWSGQRCPNFKKSRTTS